MAARRRREYLQLLDAAKAAIEVAVDAFNRVRNPYRGESALILLANAWELLAKAVLVQKHRSIKRGNRGETIGAEVTVARMKDVKVLNEQQIATIQQVISLRHAAVHHVLPRVPQEVMHHLLFYSVRFFRHTVEICFPGPLKGSAGSAASRRPTRSRLVSRGSTTIPMCCQWARASSARRLPALASVPS